ncbi:hypothetical protein [Kitasatospora sp. NPDC057223]|uniref:hypothetical protein n=1 Tax=Kitasatospora sp. NPDC057223 TaxID=3346055 RepID=UPI0036352828
MNELEPHGQAHDAADRDRTERCSQPPLEGAVEGVVPASRRGGGRLGEQVLIGICSTIGASAVIWALQFLAAHVEVHWR